MSRPILCLKKGGGTRIKTTRAQSAAIHQQHQAEAKRREGLKLHKEQTAVAKARKATKQCVRVCTAQGDCGMDPTRCLHPDDRGRYRPHRPRR